METEVVQKSKNQWMVAGLDVHFEVHFHRFIFEDVSIYIYIHFLNDFLVSHDLHLPQCRPNFWSIKSPAMRQ